MPTPCSLLGMDRRLNRVSTSYAGGQRLEVGRAGSRFVETMSGGRRVCIRDM
jgi:hypothetical protein